MAGVSEFSEGGSEILRYDTRRIPFTPAVGDTALIEAVQDHVEQHVGPISSVFHEVRSDLVHVDVHLVPASSGRPYHTLVTSGMSEVPMVVPCEEGFTLGYAELMIALPRHWPLSGRQFREDTNFWPIQWLTMLARLPHAYDSWLGFGHTVPNGEPPEPLATNNSFTGVILLPPLRTPDAFSTLQLTPDKAIDFFALVPIYPEEMELKLREGTDLLIERFNLHGVDEVVNLRRRNLARHRRRWRPF